MIIPIKCFTCGKVLADKHRFYVDTVKKMKTEAKTPGYKHIHLGGSDTSREEYEIKQDWVKEIWDKVNPGMKLLRHYLNAVSYTHLTLPTRLIV